MSPRDADHRRTASRVARARALALLGGRGGAVGVARTPKRVVVGFERVASRGFAGMLSSTEVVQPDGPGLRKPSRGGRRQGFGCVWSQCGPASLSSSWGAECVI
jgi:hypothetical protein